MTAPEVPVTPAPVSASAPNGTQPVKRKSVKLPIIFMVLSAVVIIASFNLADLNASERERFNEAKNSGNTATGTVVDVKEDKERSGGKRQRTTTVYCPVYEFSIGQDRTRTFTDRINCEDSEDAVVIGSTAPIIYAAGGSSAFADTQSTRDLIANKATGNIWLLVIGGVTFAIATLVLVTRLVKRG